MDIQQLTPTISNIDYDIIRHFMITYNEKSFLNFMYHIMKVYNSNDFLSLLQSDSLYPLVLLKQPPKCVLHGSRLLEFILSQGDHLDPKLWQYHPLIGACSEQHIDCVKEILKDKRVCVTLFDHMAICIALTTGNIQLLSLLTTHECFHRSISQSSFPFSKYRDSLFKYISSNKLQNNVGILQCFLDFIPLEYKDIQLFDDLLKGIAISASVDTFKWIFNERSKYITTPWSLGYNAISAVCEKDGLSISEKQWITEVILEKMDPTTMDIGLVQVTVSAMKFEPEILNSILNSPFIGPIDDGRILIHCALSVVKKDIMDMLLKHKKFKKITIYKHALCKVYSEQEIDALCTCSGGKIVLM